MSQALHLADLSAEPIEAAACFHRDHLDPIQTAMDQLPEQGSLAVVLPRAGHDQDDWRRAVVRDLARSHAPKRINFTTSGQSSAQDQALDEMLVYLAGADGITGQYLPTHD